MEEAVPGEAGIKKDRVLIFPGEDPDKTGEAVFGKKRADRVERQPVVH